MFSRSVEVGEPMSAHVGCSVEKASNLADSLLTRSFTLPPTNMEADQEPFVEENSLPVA